MKATVGSASEPPPLARSPRRTALKLALAAITTLACLAIVEIGLRLNPNPFIYTAMRNTVQNTCTRPHPTIQYVNRENYRGEFRNPEFRTRIVINEQGLRDRSYPSERPEGHHRVLVLGDSYAFGWGVEAEETLAKRLEADLTGLDVLNGGCSGWGTEQQLLFLQEKAPLLHPDIVLLLFVENDPANNFQRYKFVDGRLRDEGEPTGRVANFKRWMMRHFAVWNLVRQAGRAIVHQGGQPASVDVEEAKQWSREVELLREMHEYCRAHHLHLGVLYGPTKDALGEPYRAAGFSRLQSFCSAEKIPFLDLVPPLLEANRQAPTYFRLDDHWNARGHQVAAAATRRFLDDLGWLR